METTAGKDSALTRQRKLDLKDKAGQRRFVCRTCQQSILTVGTKCGYCGAVMRQPGGVPVGDEAPPKAH